MKAKSKHIRLLLIEDSADDAELLNLQLKKSGFEAEVTRVETLAQLSGALQAGGWDVIISDYKLTGFTAVEALAMHRKSETDIPFIVVSGTIGEETAAQMMKAGAQDFFLKERLSRLAQAIEREIRDAATRSEHKRAVAQLVESEKRFRILADAAPVMIWGTTADMTRDYFNRPWLDFRGRVLAMEREGGWIEGVHLDDSERVAKTLATAFAAQQAFAHEYRLRRYDGEYRWLLERGIPRMAPEGGFDGFLGSCVDITEHKHMEQDLKRSVQSRDEFLSAASHELRTPLTALALQFEIIQKSGPEGGLGDRLDIIKRQIWRLSKLVDSMLDVTRLAAGRMQFAPAEINLQQIVIEVVAAMRASIELSGSQLTVHAPLPVIGFWDSTQLETVVSNLLTNAIKYGAGKPIEVRLDKNGPIARLAVADRGIGIARDAQDRIFERFERGVPNQNYGGLGIGLWIVRQLVAAHGGVIRVSSELGAGSTFEVELPLSSQPETSSHSL